MDATPATPASRLTVLHTSDWQCGRPFLPTAAEALVRLAPAVGPDVVVASGDLTQRAKVREYRAAKALLDRLPDVPKVVTPGNHDVPLYRAWERALDPFRNWRRTFGPDLDTVTRVPGATFVALCSAAPRRAVINGRLDAHQLALAERAFDAAPQADLRILVIHHHFVPAPGGEGGPPLPAARRWLERFEQLEVDAVFGGHVHRMHVRTSRDVVAEGSGPGVPLIACGTTTSRRGRHPEEGWNSLTVTRFEERAVRVTPYRLAPGATDFEPDEPMALPLRRARRADGLLADGVER